MDTLETKRSTTSNSHDFTPEQRAAIRAIKKGQNVILVGNKGYGKTLAITEALKGKSSIQLDSNPSPETYLHFLVNYSDVPVIIHQWNNDEDLSRFQDIIGNETNKQFIIDITTDRIEFFKTKFMAEFIVLGKSPYWTLVFV